jgi:general secretion pathway protein D
MKAFQITVRKRCQFYSVRPHFRLVLNILVWLSCLALPLSAISQNSVVQPQPPLNPAPATGSEAEPILKANLQPTPQPSPDPRLQSKNKQNKVTDIIESLDFKDAPIEEVIRTISGLTGRNFILDPSVKGRITILAPTPVTVDEAYKAFLSALAINGFTVVPSGKFLKVLPARTAQRDSIETFVGKGVPASDQMVTRIYRLNHLAVADVNRYLRTLPSKDGDMITYEPTNSLILTDYGSNIRRVIKILEELDRPGFEERMSVIPIRFAKAKDIAAMIEKIVGKNQLSPGASSTGVRTTTTIQRSGPAVSGTEGTSLSLVTPDERTNSLIVVGNQAGIDRIRTLVEEIDFDINPGEGGGVFVYRLRHSVAESIANTLNGLTRSTNGSASGAAVAGSSVGGAAKATGPNPTASALFGGDVKIVAEKNTNNLIIVASKQDYDAVQSLLAKIDVPRDQVYVEAVIMEINSDKTRDWKVSAYYLDPASNGVGRAGFAPPGALTGLLNPASDSGAVLSFGRGEKFTAKLGDLEIQIPSLLAFVNFLQQHADANILSTPQILAMDNEEAQIEVGDQVPIGVETQTTQGGVITSAPRFEKATIKLNITPNVSPNSSSVRMKVEQSVKQASEATVRAERLRDITTIISDRSLKTNIVVRDQDTVVLGGLIRDEDVRSETKIPILGDLPILGWLFKASQLRKKKINLLVLLTPRIVRAEIDSRSILINKLNDRKRWIELNGFGEDPFSEKVEAIIMAPQAPPNSESPEPTTEGQTEPAAESGSLRTQENLPLKPPS